MGITICFHIQRTSEPRGTEHWPQNASDPNTVCYLASDEQTEESNGQLCDNSI